MSADKDWFKIDRKGLAKLIERRGKAALVFELISNAFDAEGTTRVEVTLTPEDGVPKVWLTVNDDAPDGFADLSHAYTVFAESSRKAHAEKRGRFNLGEKLVLALCDEASIVTTSGGVMFDARGRHAMKAKRASGSEFMGLARITRAELTEILTELRKIIPPQGMALVVNRETVPYRFPIASFEATLPTEIADEDGVLRRSRRKTTVHVFEPYPGEQPMLYEMGIPVVETGDKWHVFIDQKIPLNMDRDNVTPAFLREVRTHVVNHLHDKLTEADAAATFVNEALADEDASPEAVRKALDLKYGEKRAIWDPTDHEANMNLTAQGYTLIKGSQLTKEQWSNVKRHDAERTKPAGQLAPTKSALFGPGGKDSWVPRDKWTAAMLSVTEYTRRVSQTLLDAPVTVGILSDVTEPWGACFGDQGFVFNLGRLSHRFFNDCYESAVGRFRPTDALNALIIHELGHHLQANHLDERYHEALCSLGAKLARLALTQPELFGEKG
jgi:hypothetical protein